MEAKCRGRRRFPQVRAMAEISRSKGLRDGIGRRIIGR